MKLDELKPGAMLSHDIKGTIIFRYVLDGEIQVRTRWSEGFVLPIGARVLFLKQQNYDYVATPGGHGALDPVAGAAALGANNFESIADLDLIRSQLEKKTRIAGGLFLTSCCKKIWISVIDLKYFIAAV